MSNTLSNNIVRMIKGFNGIKNGIEYHNINIPYGTPVEEYENLIKSIAGPKKIVTRFRGIATEDLPQYQKVQALKTRSWGTLYETIPFTLTTGNDVRWSPNRKYIALAHSSNPYLNVYLFDGENFIKLPNPTDIPADIVTSISWSPDSQYIAVSYIYQPYFSVYKLIDNKLEKLPNPSVRPTGEANSVAWSPNGEHIVVAHKSSPYITLYKFSGNNLTKLNTPISGVLPSGNAYGVAWSSDNQYLSVAHDTSPFISNYYFNGIALTKLNNPNILPTANGRGVSWSSDNKYLAIICGNESELFVYELSNNVLIKISENITIKAGNNIEWSPNGRLLAISHSETPFISIYRFENNKFELMSNPFMTTTKANKLSWSTDGKFMCIAGTPSLSLYSTTITDMILPINFLRDVIERDEESFKFMGVGFVLKNYQQGDLATMDLLFLSQEAREELGETIE